MSKEEADAYFAAWRELPNARVYEEGDYHGLFVDSDILVTNRISFIGEYLPSGHTVILPQNGDSVGYNELGRLITDTYYKAYDREELVSVITDVAVKGNDPLREKRE